MLPSSSGVLTSGAVEVQPSTNPAVAGDSVTLSLSPPVTLKSGSWAVGETFIISWMGGQDAPFDGYDGRASVNVLTGALTLSSVTVKDSGVYIMRSTDPQLSANTSITVVGKAGRRAHIQSSGPTDSIVHLSNLL